MMLMQYFADSPWVQASLIIGLVIFAIAAMINNSGQRTRSAEMQDRKELRIANAATSKMIEHS